MEVPNYLVLIVRVLHRLCPIFQLSNVTGEGLDYVSVSSGIERVLPVYLGSIAPDVFESPSIQ